MHRSPVRVLAFVAVMLLALSACGVKTDTAPRDVPEAEQVDLVSPEQGAGAIATGTQRIFLIGPNSNALGPVLEGVQRDARTAEDLMKSLMAGANADEVAQQFRSAIPVGTEVRSAVVTGATLRVDLSEEILQLSGSDLVDALAQIVFTAAELQNVTQVRLLVNGAAQQWPIGDGTLQSTPLDVYDYPGRVASTQPPYPAIPPPPAQQR